MKKNIVIILLFICYSIIIPSNYAIKMADPSIINDGSNVNNETTENINDNLLNEYVNDEPKVNLEKEIKKNEWDAMNDDHEYDSYDMQNYGGLGDDNGVDENAGEENIESDE